MGNYFKFIIITAIACLSSLEAHSQLLKSVYNPQVYGDPYGNKTEYYVRMSKENTTIIRAPHKDKDSREQFEMRTHKRLIDIYSPSAKTIEALNKLELPAGVSINIKL